jgi:hypothetical protein
MIKIPDKEILIKMILEEEKIRTSKEYQDRCTAVKDIPNGWLQVTEDVQRQIVRDNGFLGEINEEIALNRLRRAQYIYPDEPVFKTPVYVRNNKARKGDTKIGDRITNFKIFDSNREINLHDKLIPEYNLILTSSHT